MDAAGIFRAQQAIRGNAQGSKNNVQTDAARNRVLLAGAVWTLAVVAAHAWFKSAAFEPITLMSIGAVGLGWAALLLQALNTERRAAQKLIAVVGHENLVVIDELADVISMEMQRAHVELGRVDDLLAHAIEQLMSAFNSVGEQARSHQDELARMASEARGGPGAEELRAAAEQVAKDVNGAVMALQFRDVVGQKLGHVRRELEALEQVMRQIRMVSGGNAAAPPKQADLAALVQGLLREMKQTRATSPVQQELMHAGEIDLF